ncbi:MAG: redoxin domain-containing protein [Candidatus Omnitrophica bacterium]|nr:redoxin domain-containing protein [Candidatus Omnitrophota bacterium]
MYRRIDVFMEIFRASWLKYLKTAVFLLCAAGCSVPVNSSEETFSRLDGGELTYAALTQGPRTVLFLWTTWCPHCRSALAALDTRCAELDQRVEYYFVNLGEAGEVVERYAENKKFTPCTRERIILDRRAAVAKRYRVVGIPTYVFLKDGDPVHKGYSLNAQVLQEVFENE